MKIAFYKSKKRVFNRLVSWWTRGPYSHVELVLHQTATGDMFCGSSSNTDGGVRCKYIDMTQDRWDVFEISAEEVPAHSWFEHHAGEGYDFLGLFGFIGRRGTQDQRKWFCSEAVAAALGVSEPWRYDPNALYAYLRDKLSS